jgi:hypothetical protein
MSKDFDSQSGLTQSDATMEAAPVSSNTSAVETTASTASLKLVTPAVSEPVYKSVPSPRHYFTAEVRKRSPYDFIMVARDPFHRLYCELPLSFEENQEDWERSFSLVCEFPTIGDDQLVDFIQGDEDLLGMTLISFHVHILNNLFLFCAARKANKLIIRAMEGHFHGLGIYEDFIEHVDKVPTKKGMAMDITIPFQAQSLVECDEFTDDITRKFRKTLWQDQSGNSAIRDYLKANTRLSIVTGNPHDGKEAFSNLAENRRKKGNDND